MACPLLLLGSYIPHHGSNFIMVPISMLVCIKTKSFLIQNITLLILNPREKLLSLCDMNARTRSLQLNLQKSLMPHISRILQEDIKMYIVVVLLMKKIRINSHLYETLIFHVKVHLWILSSLLTSCTYNKLGCYCDGYIPKGYEVHNNKIRHL